MKRLPAPVTVALAAVVAGAALTGLGLTYTPDSNTAQRDSQAPPQSGPTSSGAVLGQAGGPSPSPTALAGQTVLLLGDSLAAGEGAGSYLTGTDEPHQRCHRSATALFSGTGADVINVGCSRAIIRNLAAPQQHSEYNARAEPAQLAAGAAALAGRTADITVVMVGGNDIRFAEIFNMCVLSDEDCSANSLFTAQAIQAAEGLSARLGGVYRDVAAAADGKTVLVPAYPQLFSESGPECGRISSAEAAFARGLTAGLNRAIRQAAQEAAAAFPGVRFVPDTVAALSGHGACDPDPFVHSVLPTSLIGAVQAPGAAQELLHPTAAGYGKLTEAISRWLAVNPSVTNPAP